MVQCLRLVSLAVFMDCALSEQPLLPPLQFFNFFSFLVFSQKIFKYTALREAIRTNHLFSYC